jgi:hypothetical protein
MLQAIKFSCALEVTSQPFDFGREQVANKLKPNRILSKQAQPEIEIALLKIQNDATIVTPSIVQKVRCQFATIFGLPQILTRLNLR